MSKETQEQLTIDNLVEDIKDILQVIATEIYSIDTSAKSISNDIVRVEGLLESKFLENEKLDDIRQALKDIEAQNAEIQRFAELQNSRIKKLLN